MKKRTKWTIRIATVALALVALFALTGCRVSDMLGGSDVNTISGTYKVSAGDLATNGSDTDVAQNVANDMLIATLELRCTDSNASSSSAGTGFIVTSDGYVVTNAHVVTYEKYTYTYDRWGRPTISGKTNVAYGTVLANFYSDRSAQFEMEVVDFDADLDLALLKFQNLPEGGFERVVTFADSEDLKYGQVAVAIGNANGYGLAVTSGVVSMPLQRIQTEENGTVKDVIQTDAAINPGNSGGPLFDKYAHVIGVNSLKIVEENTENMGYAIPANTVKSYLDRVASEKGITVAYQTV